MCYAKRFVNAQPTEILQLPPQTRLNVMKALTALSKYLGCYQRWKATSKQYNLKWTTGSESIASLERFFNPNLTRESLLSKVREMMRVVPSRISVVIEFACLTGLRPSEACESARLLNRPLEVELSNGNQFDKSLSGQQFDKPITGNKLVNDKYYYYNPDRQILQHYLFPNIFLRPTKKGISKLLEHRRLSCDCVFRPKYPPPGTL